MNINLIKITEGRVVSVFNGIWHHVYSDIFSKFSVTTLLKNSVVSTAVWKLL